MKLLKYLGIILFAITLSSCSNGKVINDEEKFAALYVDLLISSEKNSGDINRVKSERQKIFSKYEVTPEEYKATLNYYSEKPDRWKEFFDRVNARIVALRKNNKV
ncbi:MAG: DUF4296 domain-containing protein [Ignavibacteria bacterium]|nr:DUF4296 domain-containing protein [Ignavibacteria bacterium]MCU7505060.1 DUF4296 domain-containing protein [Ignavibacteria bacterium]MCU7515300.1 DUF4296 domain-containing protein [Ignavibacteria bacterium]